jgi:hypothetical protein
MRYVQAAACTDVSALSESAHGRAMPGKNVTSEWLVKLGVVIKRRHDDDSRSRTLHLSADAKRSYQHYIGLLDIEKE